MGKKLNPELELTLESEETLDTQPQVTEEQNNAPVDNVKPRGNKSLIIIIIVVVLLGLATGGYLLLSGNQNKDNNSSNNDNHSSDEASYVEPNNDNEPIIGYVNGDGVYLRSEPSTNADKLDQFNKGVQIEILEDTLYSGTGCESGWYKVQSGEWHYGEWYKTAKGYMCSKYVRTKKQCESFYNDDFFGWIFSCYNVVTLDGGITVVRVSIAPYGDEDLHQDIFLVDKNNKVAFLTKYSDTVNDNIKDGILIDHVTTIPRIFPEDDIVYKGVTFEFIRHHAHDFYYQDIKKLSTTKYGDLYLYRHSSEFTKDPVYTRVYFIKTSDGFFHTYEPKNSNIFIYNSDDERFINVTWKDNMYDDYHYYNVDGYFSGYAEFFCFGETHYFVNDFNESKGIKIGVINGTNKPIYKITDNKLLTGLYEDSYSWQDYNEFKSQSMHIVYQNDLNEWIILFGVKKE